MALPENRDDIPMWVQNQRNSWHGVEFPFHSGRDFREIYKRYAEALLAVDESVGRVVDYLKMKNLFDSTLIIYMGDNGFMFGEHGILDKRAAYEQSMRVPMLMQCPELFKAGTVVPEVVANIDIAPTILEAAGLKTPDHMDGKSFTAVAQGKSVSWRDYLLYEYTGRGISHTLRRSMRCAATGTSTSTTTASGTQTNSSTSRKIRRRRRT